MKPIRKVILMMTDTQRKDMVGCYGNPRMITPNIDALAADGIRFEKAYTAQPVCQPARAALFTGQYPRSTGGWTNSMGMSDDAQTIGQRLSDQGIHTAYIGKWHLDGGDYFGMGRCPKGWDPNYWYDMRNYLEELTPEERVASRKHATISAGEGIKPEFTFGHRCSNRAIDFLEKHHEEDFFMVVSYDEPHGPCLAPKKYGQMYMDYYVPVTPAHRDPLEGKPEHHKVWAGVDETIGHRTQEQIERATNGGKGSRQDIFFGCNTFVDDEIGRVMAAIEAYAPDALVIYTSDHGTFFGEHGLCEKGPAMYNEITNIPLVMKCKAFEKEGVVDQFPVSHVDIAPTVFDMMGVPMPKMFVGKSLRMQIMEGTRARDQIFMEFGRFEVDHDGFGGVQLVRATYDGRYKLVINLLTSDELYDLEVDPYEVHNLIEDAAYGEIRDRLHDVLLEEMNTSRDPFRGYYWERRPWRKDARSATWAYTGMTRQKQNEEYEPKQLDYNTGLEMTEATRSKG